MEKPKISYVETEGLLRSWMVTGGGQEPDVWWTWPYALRDALRRAGSK